MTRRRKGPEFVPGGQGRRKKQSVMVVSLPPRSAGSEYYTPRLSNHAQVNGAITDKKSSQERGFRRNRRADGNPFRIEPPPVPPHGDRNGTARFPSLRMPGIVPS